MENSGFIKLHRSMTEWEWYDDIPTKVLFLDLLFLVNWKDKKWHGKLIKRGELITSLDHLSKHSKLSKMQVRTALKKLQSTNEIEVKSTHRYTHIKIVNYNKYQDFNTQITHDTTDKHYDSEEVQHEDNTLITHKQHSDNTVITLTKEYKESKESKNIIYSSLQNAYNTHCPSLPNCTKITDQRKRMIDARLKDYSEEDFITVFKNAEESDFLSGRSGDWNSCNFDWLIKPNNFVKVLEGTYKNSKPKKQKSKIQSHTYDFDDLERKLNKTTRGKK